MTLRLTDAESEVLRLRAELERRWLPNWIAAPGTSPATPGAALIPAAASRWRAY
jgi:hypothetical protein